MKNILSVIAILLLSVYSMNAQNFRAKAPQPGPAPKIQIGDYTKFELANGLKIFVIENHRLPRISYSLSFIFDPIAESPNIGVGSIASQLIGTGTQKRTKDQINSEIDFISATLSTGSSGIYGSSLTKHTEKLLEIMADVTINSKFTDEELERLRKQSLSGLASEKDDPHAIANNVSKVLCYGKNHPYGEFETEASLKSVSLDMCKKYYQTYFKPNIAYLSIVGDIKPADAKKLVEKYFSAWQKGDVKTTSYPKPQPPSTTKVAIVDRPQSVQSIIDISYPVELNISDPNFLKARVTNTILGGGFFRLNLNLREKHAYTYGAYSSLNSNPIIGNFTANTSVRNAVTDSATSQILYEMKRIRTEPVPLEELTMAKNYITGNFALSLENPQTIASFATNTERYKLPKDFYANYLKNIEAVTSNDILETAKKFILPDNANILIVGKASEVAEKLKKLSPTGKIEYYDNDANLYDPDQKSKSVPQGMNAKTVLDNYIKAVGGEANIAKVKDLTVKASMSVQGMSLSMNMIYKIPGKMFSEVLMGTQSFQKVIINGNTGKMSGMQGNKDLTAAELEEYKLKTDPFPENKYEKLGYKAELKGITKVDDKDAYEIEIISHSNNSSTDYYSVETNLKIKSVSTSDTPMGKVSMESKYSDYMEVSGIKYPKTLKQTMGPQSFDIIIDSVEVNTNVKDEIFN